MGEPLASLEQGSCKAEIYDVGMPGQFLIRYHGKTGEVLAEEPLTGVSSYRQREEEIRTRLSELCASEKTGHTPPPDAALSDSGEY